MDAETAARHLQLDSPMRPQVIKFCYKERPMGHSRNGKDDSSQDPKIQFPSSPLSRQSLSTSVIPTYHAGGFYEIDHERLPPRTPIHLKSIRMVKVSEYTSLDITVSFPSLMALRSFFSSFPVPSAGPELVERFVMRSSHAALILQLDSPMRPQVIKFCYKERPMGHSRNGKDDSSQDPKIQFPSSPLSRQSLSTSVIPTYHAGGFYEIHHERLPPRTPIHLKSIRVVKVSEYTSLDITVSFPSLMALRSFLSSFPAPSTGPELVERFVMRSSHAALILQLDSPMRPQVIKFCYKERPTGHSRNNKDDSSHDPRIQFPSSPLSRQSLYTPVIPNYHAGGFYEIDHERLPPRTPTHLKSIRVVKVSDYKSIDIINALSQPATLLDTLSSPEAPPAQPKALAPISCLIDTLKYRDSSKEASIDGYETEASVKEQQPPVPEDKRSLISGKRKRDGAETTKHKATEKMFSLRITNSRIARVLFTLTLILTLISPAGCFTSTCDHSHLADGIIKNCNSMERTIECCEPIVFAVDVGGGVDCLCLVSHDQSIIETGHTYRAMLAQYIDCGGLHPEAYHHASIGMCAGPAASPPPPPQDYSSPPPPTSSAPNTKPPGSTSYWDGWSNDWASFHDVIGLPWSNSMVDGACFLLLVLVGHWFKASMKLVLRRIVRWAAGLLARGFGLVEAEEVANQVELAVFAPEE